MCVSPLGKERHLVLTWVLQVPALNKSTQDLELGGQTLFLSCLKLTSQSTGIFELLPKLGAPNFQLPALQRDSILLPIRGAPEPPQSPLLPRIPAFLFSTSPEEVASRVQTPDRPSVKPGQPLTSWGDLGKALSLSSSSTKWV